MNDRQISEKDVFIKELNRTRGGKLRVVISIEGTDDKTIAYQQNNYSCSLSYLDDFIEKDVKKQYTSGYYKINMSYVREYLKSLKTIIVVDTELVR